MSLCRPLANAAWSIPVRACMPDLSVAITPFASGSLVVACSTRGLLAVLLGTDEGRLMAEVRALSPHSALVEDDPTAPAGANSLARDGVASETTLRGISIEPYGTPFQQRVWGAISTIAHGSTASYGAIARTLGAPEATRAVARACAANRLALVVPCHRVIHADGRLGGYRWGVDLKRQLLEREGVRAQTR